MIYIVVAVDSDLRYCWVDMDPECGEVIRGYQDKAQADLRADEIMERMPGSWARPVPVAIIDA